MQAHFLGKFIINWRSIAFALENCFKLVKYFNINFELKKQLDLYLIKLKYQLWQAKLYPFGKLRFCINW